MQKRVAVIGAGASGLAAIKALRSEDAFSTIKAFERKKSVGGVWVYNSNASPWRSMSSRDFNLEDKPVDCEYISPMYETLYTNLPSKLMAFNGFPFPEGTDMFPHRSVVLKYLQDYAFDLLELISFESEVIDTWKEGSEWVLRVKYSEREIEERFDFLCVASGHYEVPAIPVTEGLTDFANRFPGRVMHAKYYRRPEEFKNQKILVIGNGASGLDITIQLADTALLPILRSIRSTSQLPWLPNPQILEVPPISHFCADENAIYLKDGQKLTEIDKVIFATGYYYSLPFMNRFCHGENALISDGERIRGLYEQIFWIQDPSLAFVGLPWQIVPFPIAEGEGCVMARVWSGRLWLPTKEKMLIAESERIAETGEDRKFHCFGYPKDCEYGQFLYDWCMQAGKGGQVPSEWNGERRELRACSKELKIEQLARENKG
ncbi:Thiol-specific monooxygenase [Neolecta irregularis DAH-3]|uniref:Thiol-specific monooxygenase n=1 Tax=Neolecta irregularis (strain DAH-3) TaxID=1198029 RepID=A0A1U7LGM6_NEOID|nr:Thiol-specific monooxygenase [Neolecta irregularis DAH-3]|eukprot:OLL21778.1 Thiol-specific monooxygenase [Neolecta irregularis DAH-3]